MRCQSRKTPTPINSIAQQTNPPHLDLLWTPQTECNANLLNTVARGDTLTDATVFSDLGFDGCMMVRSQFTYRAKSRNHHGQSRINPKRLLLAN